MKLIDFNLSQNLFIHSLTAVHLWLKSQLLPALSLSVDGPPAQGYGVLLFFLFLYHTSLLLLFLPQIILAFECFAIIYISNSILFYSFSETKILAQPFFLRHPKTNIFKLVFFCLFLWFQFLYLLFAIIQNCFSGISPTF